MIPPELVDPIAASYGTIGTALRVAYALVGALFGLFVAALGGWLVVKGCARRGRGSWCGAAGRWSRRS